MDITEVRIKLMETEHEERLLGFCSITFDHAFVIRDLKIIRGSQGFFVAMPSRKLMDRCPECSGKNQLRAAYCNYCGEQLDNDRSFKQPNGKAKLYSDIAHPINSECRDLIQAKVLDAYERELRLYEQPDYVCKYDDYGENDFPEQKTIPQQSLKGQSGTPPGVRVDQPQPKGKPHKSNRKPLSETEADDDFGAGLL